MKHWPLAAIALGWAVAAVVIWLSARHVEHTHRYDGCTYVADLGPQPFWACPVQAPTPSSRPAPEV